MYHTHGLNVITTIVNSVYLIAKARKRNGKSVARS